MKLALISPPATSSFAPTMAMVALRSFLQEQGITVHPIDANIGAVHYTLNPERHAAYVEPLRKALQKGLARKVQQRIAGWRVIGGQAEAPPMDEARLEAVQRELSRLWTPEGFAPRKEDFDDQLAAINDALILASLRMFPEVLTIWGQADAGGLIGSHQHNPYLHYFRDELIPHLTRISWMSFPVHV